MTKYLFRATIGPVQSFIAQARKLQDLYAGSFLLSYLNKNLIKTAEMLGADVLYPKYREDRTSYPNLFVATVNTNNPSDLSTFAEKLESSVREQWRTIAGDVLKHWKLEPKKDFTDQIETLLQFYWSAAEYRDGKGYYEAFLETLQRMGSAKTTRMFSPLSEPAGRKCELSAEHNALFARQHKGHMVPDAYILSNIDEKYLAKNETLGAVAFVKRCLEFGVKGFNSKFPDIETVAHLARSKDSDRTPGVGSSQENDSYYALVMFDGDNMGSLYSSADIDNLQAFQIELSGFVSKSSDQMPVIVNKKKGNGVVIYAGGDDFLGAMCLEHVFTTLSELRKSFRDNIDISKYTGKPSTFSAGIVIAHIKTPLGEVLRFAREAEHIAKEHNTSEKDAYCLTILKHSGEITRYTHSFSLHGSEDGVILDGMILLHKLIDEIVINKVSTSFVHQLQIEFGRILGTSAKTYSEMPELVLTHREMLKLETKRILNRTELPKDIDKKAVINSICDSINLLIDKSGDSLTDILGLLQSVAFIARQRGGRR